MIKKQRQTGNYEKKIDQGCTDNTTNETVKHKTRQGCIVWKQIAATLGNERDETDVDWGNTESTATNDDTTARTSTPNESRKNRQHNELAILRQHKERQLE